jgi:hypothetical protein
LQGELAELKGLASPGIKKEIAKEQTEENTQQSVPSALDPSAWFNGLFVASSQPAASAESPAHDSKNDSKIEIDKAYSERKESEDATKGKTEREASEAMAKAKAEREASEAAAQAKAQAEREASEAAAKAKAQAEREASEAAAKAKAQAEREASEAAAKAKAQAEREASEAAAKAKAQAEREASEAATKAKTEREVSEAATKAKTEREASEAAAKAKAERDTAEVKGKVDGEGAGANDEEETETKQEILVSESMSADLLSDGASVGSPKKPSSSDSEPASLTPSALDPSTWLSAFFPITSTPAKEVNTPAPESKHNDEADIESVAKREEDDAKIRVDCEKAEANDKSERETKQEILVSESMSADLLSDGASVGSPKKPSSSDPAPVVVAAPIAAVRKVKVKNSRAVIETVKDLSNDVELPQRDRMEMMLACTSIQKVIRGYLHRKKTRKVLESVPHLIMFDVKSASNLLRKSVCNF